MGKHIMGIGSESSGRAARAGSALVVLLAAIGALSPLSAAPPPTTQMSLDGEVVSIERRGRGCVYRGDLGFTARIDGVDVAGRVRARWQDECIPELLDDTVVGVAEVRLTGVHTVASGNPEGFRVKGRALGWPEPLVGVQTTAGGNPENFRFQGVATSVMTSELKIPDTWMNLDGEVLSIERRGRDCLYRGDLGFTARIDGVDVEGRVRGVWRDECIPELLGDRVIGVAEVRFTGVQTVGGGSPEGFRVRGRALGWPEPLVGVQTTAGTNPENFRFQGVATTADGNPEN